MERKLQRFLRNLKKKGIFKQNQYEAIYPSGSQGAGLYSNPKTRKLKNESDKLKFRAVVSSIGAYNTKIVKFLTNVLDPVISKECLAKVLILQRDESGKEIFI